MLADAQYFDSRISKLEGAGDLGLHIVEIVKNKTVVADSHQSQPRLSEKEETSPEVVETTANADGEQGQT